MKFGRSIGELLGQVSNRLGNDLNSDFHQIVFILCPNYCGSTLLSQIIATSKNSSFVNEVNAHEAETMPELRHLFPEHRRWKAEHPLNWPEIKRAFVKKWDLRKPILLDKSPPYIRRLDEILSHFPEAKFILMVRNPYAYAESLIRRANRRAEKAGAIVRRRMAYQVDNLNRLNQDAHLFIKYEELVSDPEGVKTKLSEFLPELADIDVARRFNIHNILGKDQLAIQDLNQHKIERLSKSQIEILSNEFRKSQDVMDYLGYSIL